MNGAIGALFDIDWDNYAIGVVPDMCVEWNEYYQRLQYDRGLGYFNAGVAPAERIEKMYDALKANVDESEILEIQQCGAAMF